MSAALATVAMVALIFVFSSCKKSRPEPADPIAHADSYDIWPDSIDLHNDVILRVMNDSIMELRVNGNVLDTILCGHPAPDRMRFESDYPLLDFLYRNEAALPGTERFTTTTPYEIFLNPLLTDSAEQLLQSRLRNGLVIPYQDQHLEWPAVNVNSEWLLAATELAAAKGDPRWQRTVETTARLLIDSDKRLCYNEQTGLFTGIPRYMAVARGIFPRWMTPRQIAAQSTLAVNIEYCAAMQRLAIPSDSLRRAVDNALWIPNMGYFSALQYGIAVCQTPLQATDNLAQSVAIIAGQLSPAMAATIVEKTPRYSSGVTLFQPQLPPASAEIRNEIPSSLLQTAWAIAAAKVGNRAAYSAAIGALFVSEGERLLSDHRSLPSFRTPFTIFILRGLLGMQFNPDGIFFVPNVPDNLPGEKRIYNIRYRDAILDIKLTGTGQAISTFTIDGAPSDPFVSGQLKGHHEIAITLAGPSATPGSFTELEEPQFAPLPPIATWEGRKASIAQDTLPTPLADNSFNNGVRDMIKDENPDCRLVYINGVLQEEIYRNEYQAYSSPTPIVVQFTQFYDSQTSGFSSVPYLLLPPGCRSILYASTFAKTGTKVLEDKKLASKFVESNRFKNRTVAFSFDAPAEGRYLVDLRYVNGLGIVNAQRKLALRQLVVNSRKSGIFFFPQLRTAALAVNDSWQEHTAWTNTLVVDLHKGMNELELRYYQPSPVYADPNSNMILFDLIRIVPAP